MKSRFRDRRQAGKCLSGLLKPFAYRRGHEPNQVIVGLPRGGLVVAAEIARGLRSPLGFVAVRKVGFPDNPEIAAGAIAEGGIRYKTSAALGDRMFNTWTEKAEAELTDCVERLAWFPRPDLAGTNVIIVDDGIATGATVQVAIEYARVHGAASVIVATPVIPIDNFRRLNEVVPVVAYLKPHEFDGVGTWYDDFTQVTDAEVTAVLESAIAPKPHFFSRR